MKERDFQRQVIDLATMYGWLCYSVPDSRRCTSAGFPDVFLVHPLRAEALAVELKTDRGRVRASQRVWIEALRRSSIEVYVWRPRDFDAIVERLTRSAVVRTIG